MPDLNSLKYSTLDRALGLGLIPDPVLRAGSRLATRSRTRHESRGGVEAREARLGEMIERMSSGEIAEQVEVANQQHYELPSRFFELFLGPRRKYSAGHWPEGVNSLAASEEAMLSLTCERAGIRDGMKVLDIGCGWGSLSLWIAEQYPGCEVTSVSNSATQKATIEAEADRLGLGNVTVHTADINAFDPGQRFDRAVSIEMFEHMRNWKKLLARVAGWLEPDGKLFVHVFSHRDLAYRFADTWASERFFTAGTMPSHDLMLNFQEEMVVERRWAVSGNHYARTLRAWLRRLDRHRNQALTVLETVSGSRRAAKEALGTWRLFLISTDRIWASNDGNDWMVSHYLLAPRR